MAPGVPRPTTAKAQRHKKYRAAPTVITASANHETGFGVTPLRVRMRQGIHTAPRPGTTIVKSRFRTTRLSDIVSPELGLPVSPACSVFFIEYSKGRFTEMQTAPAKATVAR
jgi:hypothetical protein